MHSPGGCIARFLRRVRSSGNTMEKQEMPFEEANAQTKLMDQLTRIGHEIRGILHSNELLQDARYSASKVKLEDALSNLVAAEDAVGFTPRLKD